MFSDQQICEDQNRRYTQPSFIEPTAHSHGPYNMRIHTKLSTNPVKAIPFSQHHFLSTCRTCFHFSPFVWRSIAKNGSNVELTVYHPLRGTSSSGVTGFTTPRYPSVCYPFDFCLLFEFQLCSSFPRRVGEGALHEKLLPLCLLPASHGQQITPTCWPCVATH
ncbi:hypothetical protein AVEN_173374-1 [Araneus ventricosus]|uniref:Uncharacterized protein n=1 Tax=Araneus ventricosus TaxID=182803 RepID=A0A4Y2NM45_ARAVE|nr:hypothetical protein AVEN_173374-1 [Araneus ventricosus]